MIEHCLSQTHLNSKAVCHALEQSIALFGQADKKLFVFTAGATAPLYNTYVRVLESLGLPTGEDNGLFLLVLLLLDLTLREALVQDLQRGIGRIAP